jgi:cytidylate kinase
MEGRDIGTVVFPNANIKIFLNSSIETRAKRRYEQAMQEGKNVTYQEILDNIKKRDELDKTKKYGALKVPEDAIILNTDNLEIEQTVQKIVDIICGKI